MQVKTFDEKRLKILLISCDQEIIKYIDALKNVISAQEHTIFAAKKKIREVSNTCDGVGYEKNTKTRGRLIKQAAELLRARLPDDRDDYPRSVPKNMIDNIRAHNEFLRVSAINLREIADGLKDL